MKYGSEQVLPYQGKEKKTEQIKRMFDTIAGTYDRLNHTLSLGIDKSWRRKGIASLRPYAPESVLDIATGTGDLAIAIQKELKTARVIGADISEEMMKIGRQKAEKAGLTEFISFEYQDCTALSYSDCTFDAVTAAFGVRNFEDIRQGISEMYRVLKPGGRLLILELSSPERYPMKQLYRFYSGTVIPTIGKWLSKENSAYHYLPESVRVVPQGKVMTGLLTEIGFRNVHVKTFTGGICSMYTGNK